MECRGQKIEGSIYVRAFCCSCNEPIRATSTVWQLCSECTGNKSLQVRAEASRPGWHKTAMKKMRS